MSISGEATQNRIYDLQGPPTNSSTVQTLDRHFRNLKQEDGRTLGCTSKGIGRQGVGSLRNELRFNATPCRPVPFPVHF